LGKSFFIKILVIYAKNEYIVYNLLYQNLLFLARIAKN
jgi:hypothetical protein